ncbi:MAG: hypothetical protein ACE5OP_05090 [Candidatus Glassbacteria bacterium]
MTFFVALLLLPATYNALEPVTAAGGGREVPLRLCYPPILNRLIVSSIEVDPFEEDDEASSAARGHSGPIQMIYWDFDDDDGNFTSGGNGSWLWGPPSTPPLATTVNNAWETGGPENYPDYDCSWLDSPIIHMKESASFLFFRHHLTVEPGWDGGNVQVSVDGGQTFEVIHPIRGYPFPPPVGVQCPEGLDGEVYSGFTEQYETAVFDIGNLAGQYVIIRWLFESDGFNNFQGWIIDDVRVFGAELE